MDVTIDPRCLRGVLTPPPSKSIAHRVILAELLAGRARFSVSPLLSEDIAATVRCAEVLRSAPPSGGLPVLDCGESGSTLRFLLPAALLLRGGGVFTGCGRLMERPVDPYRVLFRRKGILFARTGNALTVRGQLTPGEYRLPGEVSSQFVTGLLYALPLLRGDSAIRLNSPLESAAYVDLTLDILRRYGVEIFRPDPGTFRIPGGQRYQEASGGMPVLEADWSQAAFWCAANYLGNHVTLRGMNPKSMQGDRKMIELFRTFSNPNPVPVEIDLSGIPDLLPPLAVMAAWRTSVTQFIRAGRLRWKESDRLARTADLLRVFGTVVRIREDGLRVNGGLPEVGGAVTVDGGHDHRIVMAAAVLASVWCAPVTIRGAEAVNKSYPSFFTDYRALGGIVCGL